MKKLKLNDGVVLELESYADDRYTVSLPDRASVFHIWDKMTKENLNGAIILENDEPSCP